MLINDDGMVTNEASLRVTLVASYVGVPTLQRKMGSRVVIERRRNPLLCAVTIGARSFAGFSELAGVRVLMTILTNL